MMKKSLNRVLSLLLVVLMFVGIMPAALADDPVTPTGITLNASTKRLEVDGSFDLTATLAPADAAGEIAWNSSVPGVATVVNGTVTAVAAGNTVITASVGTLSATCTVSVFDKATGITITGTPTTSVEVGSKFNLTAAGAPAGASQVVTWSSNDSTVLDVSSSGEVTAKKAGKATITATAELNAEITQTTAEITVIEAEYTIELDKDEVALVLNSSDATYTPTATIKKGGTPVTGNDLKALKLTYTIQETGVTAITVNKDTGKVTAKEKTTSGPVHVIATITNPTNAEKTYTDSVAITVLENNVMIKLSNTPDSSKTPDAFSTTSASFTFDPKLVDKDGKALTGLTNETFTYKLNGVANDKTVTFTEAGGTSKGYAEHVVEIVATATLNGTPVTASKTVYLAFTNDIDYDMVLKGTVTEFDFEDTDIFASGKVDGVPMTSVWFTTINSMFDLLIDGTERDQTFKGTMELRGSSTNNTAELKYSHLYEAPQTGILVDIPCTAAYDVTLKMKATGTYLFSYIIYSEHGTKLTSGNVSVTGNGMDDISYATTYSTPIQFVWSDFTKFWTDSKSVTGTLTYVDFTIDPLMKGKLYTTKSQNVPVSAAMKFAGSDTTAYYDMDNVTYKPDATDKTAYSVSIPFVAHGPNAQALPGVVIIDLNTANTTITSRGVKFGTSLSELLAKDFKDNTGKDMGFVNFTLPKVEDGRLLYTSGVDYVINMLRVDDKTNYHYVVDGIDADKTTDEEIKALEKELKSALNCVFFIPAAGKTGKVTIEYTAYTANGSDKYEGKLDLNVTKKSASDKFKDINANSYAWAADAADFLYYEGIVNGDDKGNYNPKNSITRGDFMLMLYRAFLKEDYGTLQVKDNFKDVVDNKDNAYKHETYQAVGVAKYLGIAKGDGVSYRPTDKISREEAMTLIYRTLETVKLKLEFASGKNATTFKDYSKVSTYAQDPIKSLVANGIVAGDEKGNLNPKANITRAEMAVILHRVLTY